MINDNSHGNITKHLGCNVLLYYKFIIQLVGERIFKICEHSAKLWTKWLIASCAIFASCFFPQRSWTRQLSRITCVWRTEIVTNCCYANRQIHLTLLSTGIKFLKTSFDLYRLTDWRRQRLTDCWPCTAFCRDIFFFVAEQLCTVVMRFLIRLM